MSARNKLVFFDGDGWSAANLVYHSADVQGGVATIDAIGATSVTVATARRAGITGTASAALAATVSSGRQASTTLDAVGTITASAYVEYVDVLLYGTFDLELDREAHRQLTEPGEAHRALTLAVDGGRTLELAGAGTRSLTVGLYADDATPFGR